MQESMNRRELLTTAAMATAAACLACLGNAPNALAQANLGVDLDAGTQPSTQPALVDVGLKSDYTTDGITSTWISSHKLAVVRHAGKLFALTAICPHRHALIEADTPTTFLCPRHNSQFDIDGNVTHGPAKIGLVHYAISVADNGHVMVDKSKKFGHDQYANPACFIALT
jgi:nitrite reductase/ring-hydroxylating ferredoxin subunit